MKPQKLKNSKSRLFVGSIVMLVTQALCTAPPITLRIESLSNLELQPCTTHTVAQQLSDAVASQSEFSGKTYLTVFIEALLGVNPTCAQMVEFTQGGSFTTAPVTWTIPSSMEDNTGQNFPLGTRNALAPSGTEGMIPESEAGINSVNPPAGVVMYFILILPADTEMYYFFKGDSGYKLPPVCHASCDGCTDSTTSGCTGCQSWASVVGSTVHPSLAGRCLCPSGALNADSTACDASACHSSCQSCEGPGADKCLQCAEGKAPSSATFPTACVEACHETCGTCSGNESSQCLTCKTISTGGPLTLLNGECRCPAGKYFSAGSCVACHSDCSSCEGPGADQCLVCSNTNSIVNKPQGSNIGPCISCADPARSSTPECQGKVSAMAISSTFNGVTSVSSLSDQTLKVGKSPIRYFESGRRRTIPLTLVDALLKQIRLLGSNFVFTDFVKVTVKGLTTPADYTFTGAFNEAQNTYDVTFEFKADHDNLEIVFEVIISNYFLTNLPTTTRRRELQPLSPTNQQLLDDASLVQNGALTVNLTVFSYDQDKIDVMEETGIIVKIYIYGAIFLVSLLLILVMLPTKYDGRIIGRIFDFCFFLGFLTKLPFIPADYNTYEFIFMDKLVRVDTLQMTEVFTENKVRARLQEKFVEYSVPVIINNNATYFASFFLLSLIAVLILVPLSRKINLGKFGEIAGTIVALFVSWSLPGTFFYSGLSTLFYSFTESYGGFRKVYYYSMGFVTFILSLGFIIVLTLTEVFWGYHGIEEEKKASNEGFGSNQEQQHQQQVHQTGEVQLNTQEAPNSRRSTQFKKSQKHNIYQKLSIEGLNEKFLRKGLNINNNKKGPLPITLDHISIIRYALLMLLIIVFQNQKIAMLTLGIFIQLCMLGASVMFGCFWGQLQSKVIGVFYTAFESAFMVLLGGLLLTIASDREPNSDSGYWWGTVPLVSLIILTIVIKTAHLVVAAVLENKRSTGGYDESNRDRDGVKNTETGTERENLKKDRGRKGHKEE